MKFRQPFLAAATVALVLACGAAIAHEGAAHKDPDAAVRKEQKPWGIAGDLKSARRTIEIAMGDNMRFTPSTVAVRQGETVRFVVTNKGQLLHEMVIGDKKTLDEHAALMVRFPAMEHDEPYMAHVPAGKKETLVWTFNRPGDFDFACLVAGHYQAGMTGKITVAKAGK
ncbi:MAG: cupredoxin family protein [Pseudomonadota bacterium]|nr:cupredoxin family protein [Pseudomonadota bacterium]